MQRGPPSALFCFSGAQPQWQLRQQRCSSAPPRRRLAALVEQKGRLVLARWRNSTLARIVHAWRDDTREELRVRRALSKFVSMMRNRGAARSMASWCEFVTLRKRARKAMQWMLSRLLKDGLVKGWSSWRAFVAGAHL